MFRVAPDSRAWSTQYHPLSPRTDGRERQILSKPSGHSFCLRLNCDAAMVPRVARCLTTVAFACPRLGCLDAGPPRKGNPPVPNDAITRIEITGLRGFAHTGTLSLAVPDGRSGSGMTVITGANSAGKSVIIEALRAMQHAGQDRSFPERTRNSAAQSRVEI